jgi:hypothetical protein
VETHMHEASLQCGSEKYNHKKTIRFKCGATYLFVRVESILTREAFATSGVFAFKWALTTKQIDIRCFLSDCKKAYVCVRTWL